MSVATVQQQLHASGLNEKIEIGPYLTKLCASLAASMIGERRPLSIKAVATAGGAVSSEAVSIGLIVTELVINALKHGFPTEAEGKILVSYDAQDTGWQLFGLRQWIGAKGSERRAPTFGSRHKHRRGTSPSTPRYGPENEWPSGHHGDNHRAHNQRWHSDWRKNGSARVIVFPRGEVRTWSDLTPGALFGVFSDCEPARFGCQELD